MESRDITIPAPWGHIAVKLWGKEENTPVLVIHGLFDNAASFDRLLQLLPTNFYYICIDLPGHGKSSHWPESSLINILDNLLVYKLVVDYFNRKKYILLGHSLGAYLGFQFTQIYPEYITKLILLDAVVMFLTAPNKLQSHLRSLHETYFVTVKKLKLASPPEYTYEEVLDKIIKKRYGAVSRDAIEPVLKRMTIPLGNGKVRLSLDQRLKCFAKLPIYFQYLSDFIKEAPIFCPTLIIFATESHLHHLYFVDIYKQLLSNNNVRMEVVEGAHDVHNVHPELVAPLVSEHLLMTTSKL